MWEHGQRSSHWRGTAHHGVVSKGIRPGIARQWGRGVQRGSLCGTSGPAHFPAQPNPDDGGMIVPHKEAVSCQLGPCQWRRRAPDILAAVSRGKEPIARSYNKAVPAGPVPDHEGGRPVNGAG